MLRRFFVPSRSETNLNILRKLQIAHDKCPLLNRPRAFLSIGLDDYGPEWNDNLASLIDTACYFSVALRGKEGVVDIS